VGRVDYDNRLHTIFSSAARMAPEAVAAWIAAFGARLPTRRPLKIADVGSGTGRFTPSLAEAFGGPVDGVEPAARMRAVAERDAAHPHVRYRPGRCESIPLGDDAVDAAILFGVWHHVDHKAEAAHELFRIVCGGGTLLVRTTSRDRFPELWWYEHFPRAREIDLAMAAPLASTVSTLGEAGWDLIAVDEVNPVGRPVTCAEDFARLQSRVLSTFEHLSDKEIELGFATLAAVVARNADRLAPRLPTDLLVFTKAALDLGS
jgi:ubiquinone/menaquinone biosynthesis C-methylase UbiE